ncbi:MAG: hypothetical protein GAK28_00123 [Luteibacter sp.]|uniref:hypothetical protein n=1 Tax=Luteibacter sp. TaxID=1886636 RepID=UPI0013864767|nr:hypothetical protein [Luteibacter sp.]KAF1009485.1 MAG: hypothetical protein GAK28_00123 [Luteibacter sp.]
MAKHLIVREAFGDYAKGDRITEKVEEILASPNSANVLPINAPDATAQSRGSNSSGDQG